MSGQLHPVANMPSKLGECHYYPGLQSSAEEGRSVGIAEVARSRLRLYKALDVDPANPGQGEWHSEDRTTKSAGPRRKKRRPTTRSEDSRHRVPLQAQTIGSGDPHRRALLFPRALLVEQTRGNRDRDGNGRKAMRIVSGSGAHRLVGAIFFSLISSDITSGRGSG